MTKGEQNGARTSFSSANGGSRRSFKVRSFDSRRNDRNDIQRLRRSRDRFLVPRKRRVPSPSLPPSLSLSLVESNAVVFVSPASSSKQIGHRAILHEKSMFAAAVRLGAAMQPAADDRSTALRLVFEKTRYYCQATSSRDPMPKVQSGPVADSSRLSRLIGDVSQSRRVLITSVSFTSEGYGLSPPLSLSRSTLAHNQ